MPLPVVFDVVVRAVGGELSTNDNREYVSLEPNDDSGTGDALDNGGPIKIVIVDTDQQGLLVAGTTYRLTLAALP